MLQLFFLSSIVLLLVALGLLKPAEREVSTTVIAAMALVCFVNIVIGMSFRSRTIAPAAERLT